MYYIYDQIITQTNFHALFVLSSESNSITFYVCMYIPTSSWRTPSQSASVRIDQITPRLLFTRSSYVL